MEKLDPGKRLRELLDKYKYALIILAAGICLMLLPGQTTTHDAPVAEKTATEQQITMEMMLTQVLSQIDGAGKVSVLLSEEQGSQTIYQTDTQSDSSETTSSENIQTVIITDADRNQQGLVRRTDPPRYLGAVIVCQGADSPQVRLSIVEAVRCATGLGANQISVVKMK